MVNIVNKFKLNSPVVSNTSRIGTTNNVNNVTDLKNQNSEKPDWFAAKTAQSYGTNKNQTIKDLASLVTEHYDQESRSTNEIQLELRNATESVKNESDIKKIKGIRYEVISQFESLCLENEILKPQYTAFLAVASLKLSELAGSQPKSYGGHVSTMDLYAPTVF